MGSMDKAQFASLIRGLLAWRDKREARPPSSDRAILDKRIAEYETAIFRAELARSLRELSPTVGRNDR